MVNVSSVLGKVDISNLGSAATGSSNELVVVIECVGQSAPNIELRGSANLAMINGQLGFDFAGQVALFSFYDYKRDVKGNSNGVFFLYKGAKAKYYASNDVLLGSTELELFSMTVGGSSQDVVPPGCALDVFTVYTPKMNRAPASSIGKTVYFFFIEPDIYFPNGYIKPVDDKNFNLRVQLFITGNAG